MSKFINEDRNDYNTGLNDFFSYSVETLDGETTKSNIWNHIGEYFEACLNDIQQNRTNNEYLELMLKMEKAESVLRYDDPLDNPVYDITNDDEIIGKYINDYTMLHGSEDDIVNFVKQNGSNKNFIEEDIHRNYNLHFDERIDLSEFSQEFKQKLEQHQFKKNQNFTPDNIQEYLNDENFDNHLTDQNGNTLITAACQYANDDTVYNMIQRSDIDINQPDDFGNTPFIMACQHKPDCAIEILGQQDIDLNAQNNNGKTGFHVAVEHNPDLAIALMDCEGIDLNTPDKNGKTPFITACDETPSEGGTSDIAHEMLQRDDIDFNAQDNNGKTAFMYVTKPSNYPYMIGQGDLSNNSSLAYEMTRSEKIDMDITDNEGDTAFDWTTGNDQHIKKSIENQKLKESMALDKTEDQQTKPKKNKMKML